MPSSVIVVIPLHRHNLAPAEQVSINRCIRVLGRYKVCFVSPDSMQRVEMFADVPVERFSDGYFASIQDYNRLMMSEELYERFEQYEYMLVYQPDAFVFVDNLDYWCSKGYDYVGAPWVIKPKYRTWWGRLFLRLKGLQYRFRGKPFRPLLMGDKVGNGGFSLRRIASFKEVCAAGRPEIERYYALSALYSEFNEDAFWSTRKGWRYPDVNEALSFSFDINPEECLKQTEGRLPMGCHGWSRTDRIEFWKPLVNKATSDCDKENIRVYYDYQAFSHQKFGGVSRCFAELISHIGQYGVKPIVGIRYSDNIHLRQMNLQVEDEVDIEKSFLPSWHGGKAKINLYKLLAHIAPKRYPFPKYAKRRLCASDVARGNFDLMHATYFDTYIMTALRHKPFVITIHDMIDEVFDEGKAVPRRKALLAQHAAHIIAVSENTKRDVVRILGIPEERISVVYHGSSLMPKEPQHIPTVPERYILYVGGRQRHYKNFALFLRAMMPVVQQTDVDILCVGNTFTPTENAMIDAAGLRGHISSFFADDDQLYYIYNHAICFVFPSLYEGFGIPILEAWAADCPVILSDRSCFPEVAGDAALYFDGEDADALTKVTLEISRDENLRRQMVERGRRRRKMFSWDKAAQELAEVYRLVYRGYA